MGTNEIITLIVSVSALAVKPGPGMMMLISRTISHGIPAFSAFMLGFLLVELFYLLLVFLSFNFSISNHTITTVVVKLFATAFLIWQGVTGLINSTLSYEDQIKEHHFRDTFIAATALTLSNPLVIVFIAGIVPTLVDIQSISLGDMAVIMAIFIIVEGLVPLLYCTPVLIFRKSIPVRQLQRVRTLSSCVLIIVGFFVGFSVLEDIKHLADL